MTYGMTSWVTPPPRLPQPAAVAFTVPTIDLANICEHHTWQVTKVARPQPMKRRATMSASGVVAKMSAMMPGQPAIRRMHAVLRAPRRSQSGPAATRVAMVRETAQAPEIEMWVRERPRPPSSGLRRRYGISAAGANTEKKHEKNEMVEHQKAAQGREHAGRQREQRRRGAWGGSRRARAARARRRGGAGATGARAAAGGGRGRRRGAPRMCGRAHEHSWAVPQTDALCSSSTGRTNARPKTSVVFRELIARRVSVSWMLVISFSSEAIFSVSDCGSGAPAR